MGAATTKCCNVSTAGEVRASRRASHGSVSLVAELKGVKNINSYKRTYVEKGLLSKGSKVVMVECRDGGLKYVCRRVPLDGMPCKNMKEIGKHVQMLSGLEHPHICKFVECFEDKSHLLMIYEKAVHTRLFDHVRTRSSLTEEDAADYVRQAAMALSVAHAQGIYHGRLSPRSLILSGDEEDDEDLTTQLKICDMGISYILRAAMPDPEASSHTVEVDGYAISPELACGDFKIPPDGAIPKSGADRNDMWALGATIFHMLTGSAPFEGAKGRDAIVKTLETKLVTFSNKLWGKLTADARDCVELLLKVSPSLRISAAALLKHPWIRIAKTSFPRKRMVQLLSNLRVNVNESNFQRFVLRVMAEQMPQDSKTTETVEQAFRCLDQNGDGVLSTDELTKGMAKYLDLRTEDLALLFKEIDRDNSGTLNVSEFISATMDNKRTTSIPLLWQAFNAFDKDHSGGIALDEIDRLVKELEGALLSKEQVNELSQEIRTELEMVTSTGEIDFDQFVYVMQNSQPNKKEALKKDIYRFAWNTCAVDCHSVRKLDTQPWNLSKGLVSPRSPRSVYRKRVTRRAG